MVFLSLSEIIQISFVTVLIGYIFSGFISRPWKKVDVMEYYLSKRKIIDLDDLKFAVLISAPAVILHELGHKTAAILFGLPAKFNAYWFGLFLGVFLKFIHAPFLILAPAYVSFPSASATAFQKMIIAFSGPLVNLVLWMGSRYYLRYYLKKKKRRSNKKVVYSLLITEKLNMWLFLFNMIPLPPLDGYHVFSNLLKIIF